MSFFKGCFQIYVHLLNCQEFGENIISMRRGQEAEKLIARPIFFWVLDFFGPLTLLM